MNYGFVTKPPFSVSLLAFASIYTVADFFPKEMNSSEPGFDSPIFFLLHLCFISGITSVFCIQRLHINAICLFITIPCQSFRHYDRLTRQKSAFLNPSERSCLRQHMGNWSQPLLEHEDIRKENFLNCLIFILIFGLQHSKAKWLVKKGSFRWDLANRYDITA